MTSAQRDGLKDAALALTEPMIDDLVKDISRRIKGAGAITDTAEYQIYRAQALGASKKEVERRVAEQLKLQEEVISSLFEYVLDKSLAYEDNGSLQQMADAYAEMTKSKTAEMLQNLWGTAPDGQVLPLQDAYARALDFAFRETATGVLDMETAIRRAVTPLAKRGLRTIEQKSGRSIGIEYACRRYIMDQLGALDDEVQKANHDMLGCDGWEISAHAACAPDHEPIQGRQYSDAEYERLNNSLQRRIGHLNCGHTAGPIILGVNAPQYTEAELKQFAEDNEKGITYNGKHYTLYQAGQEQATMENAIRNLRRQILADEETKSPDLQKHQIRLRVLQSEYTRFCKAAKLPTRNERLQVAGFGRSQASKAVWTYRKDTQSRKLQKLNYAEDVTAEQRSSIEKELSVLPQAQREAAERQIHSLRLEDNNTGSHYDPKTKEIVLSTTHKTGDVIHEYGHALERALKLERDPAFAVLREKGIDLADASKIVYDETTFTEPIWRMLNDKFVSEYQGRMYESAGIYDGHTINLTSMKEYFAEGYREFYVNPENLRLHDPDLYDYIRRLLHDQE
mgnify:FL=1